MAGPDVNYSMDNPFEPTRLTTLTSSNSGFGHEILRDNGGLEFNTIEVERSDYSIKGELDDESAFENPYLDSFQNTSSVGSLEMFLIQKVIMKRELFFHHQFLYIQKLVDLVSELMVERKIRSVINRKYCG